MTAPTPFNPYAACEAHPFPVRSCVDCHAAKNSAYLRAMREARKAIPTPDEWDDFEVLRVRYRAQDMSRDGESYRTVLRARSLTEVLDEIDRLCRGDVS